MKVRKVITDEELRYMQIVWNLDPELEIYDCMVDGGRVFFLVNRFPKFPIREANKAIGKKLVFFKKFNTIDELMRDIKCRNYVVRGNRLVYAENVDRKAREFIERNYLSPPKQEHSNDGY